MRLPTSSVPTVPPSCGYLKPSAKQNVLMFAHPNTSFWALRLAAIENLLAVNRDAAVGMKAIVLLETFQIPHNLETPDIPYPATHYADFLHFGQEDLDIPYTRHHQGAMIGFLTIGRRHYFLDTQHQWHDAISVTICSVRAAILFGTGAVCGKCEGRYLPISPRCCEVFLYGVDAVNDSTRAVV